VLSALDFVDVPVLLDAPVLLLTELDGDAAVLERVADETEALGELFGLALTLADGEAEADTEADAVPLGDIDALALGDDDAEGDALAYGVMLAAGEAVAFVDAPEPVFAL
jgi:hypothetical protein